MKRTLLLVPVILAMAMSTTGCVSMLLSAATGHGLNWGSDSGSDSGSYDYDDSTARNTQEASQQMDSWLNEQQTMQTQDAANQATDAAIQATSDAAAASAAAAANP